MQTVNEFPDTENKPIIAISSGYSETCIVRSLFYNKILYVETLLIQKQSFLSEMLHNHSDIFNTENTYILGAECSSQKACLREQGFNVSSVILRDNIIQDLFNCKIIVVFKGKYIETCAILDDFKKCKDTHKYYADNRLLWVLVLALSYFIDKKALM